MLQSALGSSARAKRTRRRLLATVAVCTLLLAACGSSGGKKSSTSTTTNKAGGGGATGTKGAAAKAHKRVGTVTAVSAGRVTIAVKRLGTLQLHTTTATKIERAGTGTGAAIAVGDRVLVVHGHDVIVLPHDSMVGRLVDHVSKQSFTIAKGTGKKAATISLAKGAVIETTSPAAMSDLKTKAEVLAVVRGKGKGAADAIEIILLPPGSPFAT